MLISHEIRHSVSAAGVDETDERFEAFLEGARALGFEPTVEDKGNSMVMITLDRSA